MMARSRRSPLRVIIGAPYVQNKWLKPASGCAAHRKPQGRSTGVFRVSSPVLDCRRRKSGLDRGSSATNPATLVMDYPNHGRGLASLCRDTRARPSHRRDRGALPNHRHYPSHHRDPTSHSNCSARSAAEPIRLSTGSNDRALGATPNRSHPILGRCPALERVAPYSTPTEQHALLSGRSEQASRLRPIR